MVEQFQHAGATSTAKERPEREAPPPRRPVGWRLLLLAAFGGLLTGAAVIAAMLTSPVGTSQSSTLQAVGPAELSEAVISLDQNAARQAIDDAKACKVPLAHVTLAVPAGNPPGNVRIRSGGYVTPSLRVTDQPVTIAIPFPTAYETGQGVITIEGTSGPISVWLAPIWSTTSLAGTLPINVKWTPNKPCG